MDLEIFLNNLLAQDVYLWVEGEKIKFSAPPGTLTPELRTKIDAIRHELLAHLKRSFIDSERAAQQYIPRFSRDLPLPLSFSQQRLWFIHEYGSQIAYNVPIAIAIQGNLDIQRLQNAFEALIHRHEVLRTSFETRDGDPWQRIHEAVPFKLEVQEVNLSPYDAAKREMLALVAKKINEPFDLRCPPLLRASLIKLADNEAYLVITMHHIISDAWSMEVLFRELTVCMKAEASLLPSLSIQYADFALWQRHALQGKRLKHLLDYWKDKLAEYPPLLDLPADLPPSSANTGTRGEVKRCIAASLAQQIRAAAQKGRASPFIVLLAGLQTLLFRYSGMRDFIIGVPVTERQNAAVSGLIGLFVNSLAIRTQISEDSTFVSLIDQARTNLLEAQEHSVPFEKLVEMLKIPRNTSAAPLFQIMATFQEHTLTHSLIWPGLTLELLPIDVDAVKLDITVAFIELLDTFEIQFTYDATKFSIELVKQMADNFERLLAAALNSPAMPINRLTMLADTDFKTLMQMSKGLNYLAEHSLLAHERFLAQARANPNAIAIISGDLQMTYKQLAERANALARLLRSRGVGPDVLVGLCMDRSAPLCVAILAVLMAGGAYVPLDPVLPLDRLRYYVNDAKLSLVLTRPANSAVATELAVPCLLLDDLGGVDTNILEDSVLPQVQPAATAYVIYTSGSTGAPKGVVVPHASLISYVDWCIRNFGQNGVGCPIHSTFSFDLTVTPFFVPLLTSRTIELLPTGNDIDSLSNVLRSGKRYSFIKMTPSHLRILNETLANARLEDLTAPENLLVGGETLHLTTLSFWRQAFPSTRIVNMYGPTEITVACTAHEVTSNDMRSAIPIGRPIDGAEVYVLDDIMQPQPIGVWGELYIGGAGVTRGYLHRPELTAERFVPNPFSSRGSRLYRSGDIVRMLHDGTIEFLGRRDGQVKIRGHRIEMGEIEAALAQAPGVRQAAVLVENGANGDARLAAYVACESETFDLQTVKTALRERLPEYMIPPSFYIVDELPITENGKVDKRTLTQHAKPVLQTIDKPESENATAQHVARLFQASLGLASTPSTHANFFELGGHSLLVTKLSAAITKECGVTLPLATIFEQPTSKDLAYAIERARSAYAATDKSGLAHLGGGKNAAPLFLVHGAGGLIEVFGHLAAKLASSVMSLAFLPPDRSNTVGGSINEMAHYYLTAMQRIQPSGPFHLCGWSIGGLIAHEMAALIEDEGGSIASLILLDSFVIEKEEERTIEPLNLTAAPAGMTEADLEAFQFTYQQHALAATRHRPRQIQAPILLLQATAEPHVSSQAKSSQIERWRTLTAGSFEIIPVSTTHAGILTPPAVELVANAMQLRIT